MKQSSYTVRIIEPSEGHVLTQTADVPLPERVFSGKVFLSVSDDPGNWKEITAAEAGRMKEEQRMLSVYGAEKAAEEEAAKCGQA